MLSKLSTATFCSPDGKEFINLLQDFILGKYDAKIHKIKLSQPGRSVDSVLQEFKAKGVVGVIVPSTRKAIDNPEDYEVEPISSGSCMGSSEIKDADSSSSSHTSDEDNRELDLMIEQVIYRRRRDSGMEMEDEGDVEKIHGDPPEYKVDAPKAESHFMPDEDADLENRPQPSEVFKNSQERATGTLKRILPRQEGIDVEGPSTSKRKGSNVGIDIEDERRASSSTNRSSLSSVGSQDSVTSQLDRRLNLESGLSIQEGKDTTHV